MQSGGGYDINELRREAQKRWLKPSELLFILQNFDDDQLIHEPPQNPTSGSLFLLNRKILRHYRKDGHSWRKKKNGRTVGEAHEHLKVGNADTLNCYYAHGDQNPNFQRRIYWMLDPACGDIALVHYRQVTEGRYIVGPNLPTDPSQSTRICDAQNPDSSGSSEPADPCQNSVWSHCMDKVSSKLAVGNNERSFFGVDRLGDIGSSSEPESTLALPRFTEQLSLDGEHSYSAEKLPSCSQNENFEEPAVFGSTRAVYGHDNLIDHPLQLQFEEHGLLLDLDIVDTGNQQHSQPADQVFSIERKESPSWKELLECYLSSTGTQEKISDQVRQEEFPDSALMFIGGSQAKDMTSHDGLLESPERSKVSYAQDEQPEHLSFHWLDHRVNDADYMVNTHQTSENNFLQLSTAEDILLDPRNSTNEVFQEIGKSTTSTCSYGTSTLDANSGMGMLTKTNSTGWMDTRHVLFDYHKYCSEYSMFDQNSLVGNPLGPDSSLTVSQMQRFSIREISPEWAYTTGNTKVIITGDFLCDSSDGTWACMFGETEVHAEVIQTGVLRCHAPPHVVGKVNFCVTAGNRESCSEVREFEYCALPESPGFDNKSPQADTTSKSSAELHLLVRFAEILFFGYDNVSVQKEDSCKSESNPSRNSKLDSNSWRQIIEALSVGRDIPSCMEIMDWLLQELLKDKLQHWLSSKCQEDEGTICPLSKKEQGVIHMVAGLGYEWALNSVLNSGVGINFRDGNGWTALHWAARFGREKMVAALLAAGASAVAVTDATSQDPVGKNPASIAASNGHRGLAGYLSEVALTSHLSLLTLEESEFSKGSAAVEAERAMESIAERTENIPVSEVEDKLSLKDSLAAARNAALAAARIQAAFRAHSFRKKRLRELTSYDENGWTLEDMHGLSAAMKFQWAFHKLHSVKLNKAALFIQKKYRGWKSRREFLTFRKNVVKIQAHVRGHQVRKKYKELLWTVSILEKIILRWRRKGDGLRGFRGDLESIDEAEDDDVLKVFRKQKVHAVIEEAVSRVLSMIECPDARHQYRRILERYRQAKVV
eukprot:TRINITY_DN9687_c0_g1_i4.p1 TRINITY_DN9687_c0_g1~~TRINITY_DN9687_c0_g1_i4.p1  ORF type:complete len:1051 (-),score=204.80 TRINITY_DN9687_c0_g1_i4:1229-4381(-)